MSQLLRTNSVASQSSSSGWLGNSARTPKSSDVCTMPVPKNFSQRRLTATRAVSGLVGLAIQSARPSRLLGTPGGSAPNAVGMCAVTTSPGWSYWPRRRMWATRGVGISSITIVVGMAALKASRSAAALARSSSICRYAGSVVPSA